MVGKSHNHELSSCQYGMSLLMMFLCSYYWYSVCLLFQCVYIKKHFTGRLHVSICILKNELFKITFSQEKQSSACSIVYSFRCLDTFYITLQRPTEVILGVSPYTNDAFISKWKQQDCTNLLFTVKTFARNNLNWIYIICNIRILRSSV